MLLLLPVVIVVWFLSRTASWWNPKSWWDDASKGVVSVINDVKKWTLSVVRDAVNLLSQDVHDVLSFAVNGFSTVYNLATTAYEYAQGAVADLGRWATNEITTVTHYAEHLYNLAYGYASTAINSLTHYAEHLYNLAVAFASKGLHDLGQLAAKAIGDLARWASKGLNDLTHLAEHLHNEAVHYADKVGNDTFGRAYKTVKHDFIDPIEKVLDVVRKAWDWVFWFATHPFKVVHDVENDVIKWVDHLPEDLAQIVESHDFHRGLDAFGKALGG